jgi:glycosyltransferase involved in cell wall biosynthesis
MPNPLSLSIAPRGAIAKPLRLAVICDYLEDNWVSMNFCAEMLLSHLQSENCRTIQSKQIRPAFQRRLQRLPKLGQRSAAFRGDRMLNCFWDYPRYLSSRVSEFDYFHICDHSYAQLVHALPSDRTGVFCHDIDAFRPLLEPEQHPRSARVRAELRRILQGMQQAAVVFHTTMEVRRQIEHYGLIDPARLVQVPLGIAPEFSAVATGDRFDPTIAQVGEQPFILSVSSNKQRKRLDVLLDVFAAVRSRYPHLRLVRVGREREGWTTAQQAQIDRLGIGQSITYLQGLERTTLAALYRRAAIVLVTSESEGFGLPVIEALACGSLLVASDIPTLREVGAAAALYCPVGDIPTWIETVEQLLAHPHLAPNRTLRLAQAAQYSWSVHAATIAQTYQSLATA